MQFFFWAGRERIEYNIKRDKFRRHEPKHLERIFELQDYLKEEAERLGIPAINANHEGQALIEIIRRLPENAR